MMSSTLTSSLGSTTNEQSAKNNQIINDVFLNDNAPLSPNFTIESHFDEQALKDAAMEDEYHQYCSTYNITPDPNITPEQLRALSGSTNIDSIQSPYVDPILENEPFDFHPDDIEMEIAMHSNNSTTGKRLHETKNSEEMASKSDDERAPKVIHLSTPTTNNVIPPQGLTNQQDQNKTLLNDPKIDDKKGPKVSPIPPEALNNRYLPSHIYKSYDVIFQADHSQTNVSGLSDVGLAKAIVKIFEGANIRTETTTSKKIGQSIKVSFNSRDSANLMVEHPLLKSQKIVAYIPRFTIQTQGIIKNVPLDFTKEEILKYTHSTPTIIDATRCKRFIRHPDKEPESKDSLSILLTFEGQIRPQFITLYNLRFDIHPYTSPVKRCSNCLRFGHTSKSCRSKATCQHYGTNSHDTQDPCPETEKPPKCINCKGRHKSTDENCPDLDKQRKIHKQAAFHQISYSEAKDLIDNPPITNPQNNNYRHNANLSTQSSGSTTLNDHYQNRPYYAHQDNHDNQEIMSPIPSSSTPDTSLSSKPSVSNITQKPKIRNSKIIPPPASTSQQNYNTFYPNFASQNAQNQAKQGNNSKPTRVVRPPLSSNWSAGNSPEVIK